jgi:CheY-like chemotaxis protein
VDDDAAVRRTFSRLLRRSGAEVMEPDPSRWGSTAEAIQSLCDPPPDLILLDLHLRDLATSEIYTALKNDAPEIASRVVFFTGGVAPQVALDRPVVNKMLAWDDLVLCILAVVRPRL